MASAPAATAGDRQPFDRDRYRRERAATLERRVDLLEGELARALRLLGVACALLGAKANPPMTGPEILELLAQAGGDNLARAAIFDDDGAGR